MNWDKIWGDKRYITDFELRWYAFLDGEGKKMPAEAKILEAGCGSGGGLVVLADKKRTVIGVDISEKSVESASARKGVLCVRGDNFALPFADNTFDLVFNSGVIEHFKYPKNIKQVKEMARVAKDDGKIIINVPNSLCLWYRAAKFILRLLGKWEFGYEENYTPGRLKKTAWEAGLHVVGTTGFLCLPPLATHRAEFLPAGVRKIFAVMERYLPLKQYYCYTACVLCRKETR